MGQSIGDRLRELADRADALGDDLKAQSREVLGTVIGRLQGLLDKAEEGDDITAEDASDLGATQLPAGEAGAGSEEEAAETDEDQDALRPGQLPS
jgi:hypothetical protein